MIRKVAVVLALFTTACSSMPHGTKVVRLVPGAALAEVIERASTPTRFVLAAGTYELAARPYRDPSCANCQDPATGAAATLGMRISGKGVEITSPARGAATIVTNAGYGLLIEDCDGCVIDGITITGGRRDADGNASDAGIVVRNSRATIRNSVMRDNIGDPATVKKTIVGIIGIAGREGSNLVVEHNRIVRNSWDGIALYAVRTPSSARTSSTASTKRAGIRSEAAAASASA